jgi:tetratricopeptide (TPR) repeat protein
LAIFGWGKKDEKPAGDAPATEARPAIEFSATKAASWFKHAVTAHDSENYEYAATCWLSGLRFDPSNLDGVKGFLNSAGLYGKAPSRDMVKATEGKTEVDKFLSYLLQWGCNLNDGALAQKTVVTAGKLGLDGLVDYLAPNVLKLVLRDPKARKSTYVELMAVFQKIRKFDLAVSAGEAAIRLDPADNPLQVEVRNLAAQSTMSRGGFDQTGEAGGFRSNVRDLDKQRNLEEQERLVKSEQTIDRIIETTRAEYEANTLDKPSITKYAKALLERGTPEDERLAIDVLTKAHADTSEFRFRQLVGDIRIRQAKRGVKALQAAATAEPADAGKQATFAAELRKLQELEVAEYELRAAAYPTDLPIKFELGRRQLELGRHEQAIDMMQQAKSDGRLKSQALRYLAEAFSALSFDDEAIETYRQALEGHADPNDATGLELRYGLCTCLQRRAAELRDVASAEEAGKIASTIAIQQISYKDIRARRDQIKQLLVQLKSGATPA